VNTATGALSALRRLSIAIAIAVVFLFGLATTVYLSLRSPEVSVPNVVGKDRFEAERVLDGAGLNFRVRATRPSSELEADTVLFQVPRAGDVVKAGQTVAMDISRVVKEGESPAAVVPEKKPEDKDENRNTNDAAAANENQPKRKPTNKNDNVNANAASENSNRPALIINNNSRSTSNENENGRQPVVKPSPVARPTRENL
jgi:beta-lactam-binding protein with PASTA domain